MPAPVCKAALHGACINTQSKTNAKGWRVPLSASHQCCAEATADLPQLCELYLGKQLFLSQLHGRQGSTCSGNAQEAQQVLMVGTSVKTTCCLLCEAWADE